MDVTVNNSCLACGSVNLHSSLNLGEQPLANSYLKNLKEDQAKYPLGVNVCKECYHTQLTHKVNPEIIYQDYLYVSGTTKTIKEYCKWFAKFVYEYSGFTKGAVLDIGCNDGTQLNSFLELGFETWGIDPARNLYEISSKNHNVICDFFNAGLKLDRNFNTIIAQNVFAHNPTPAEFLLNCNKLMNNESLLFIQTSQANMVSNKEFDTIYHEHINFFNVLSMKKLTERVGLNLIDVIKTPVHGNSYIFVISKKLVKTSNVENAILMENSLYNLKTYIEWENYVKTNIKCFVSTIKKYKKRGFTIIGYGAAAKGNTLLNYCRPIMDYIVDDNPLKQGLYSPGVKIPIVSPDKLLEEKNQVLIVPLAWNFFEEIKEKVFKRKKQDVLFLKYFPSVKVEND